jgi:hypothetical protein
VVPDPKPWLQPVNGLQLACEIAAFFRRHAVLGERAPIRLTLWTTHTHCLDTLGLTPRLLIRAATPQTGNKKPRGRAGSHASGARLGPANGAGNGRHTPPTELSQRRGSCTRGARASHNDSASALQLPIAGRAP